MRNIFPEKWGFSSILLIAIFHNKKLNFYIVKKFIPKNTDSEPVHGLSLDRSAPLLSVLVKQPLQL
jgi:hypothetical protein